MGMKLTSDDKVIFDHLKEKGKLSMDDLLRLVPDTSRHALSVRMKYLAAKLAPEGWIVQRSSNLGRGNKAVYIMKKRF